MRPRARPACVLSIPLGGRQPSRQTGPVTTERGATGPGTIDPTAIQIPNELLPVDGRFGCGPSKVRPEQALALAKANSNLLGTSHRQAPVKNLVGSVRRRSERAVRPARRLGDRAGQRRVDDVLGRRHLRSDPRAQRARGVRRVLVEVRRGGGRCAAPRRSHDRALRPRRSPGRSTAVDGADVYALTHNETSTGVAMQLRRPPHADDDALVVVDATSAAGGLLWDPAQVDVYYFAPQKCFASDGGLWLAACSPRALERIRSIARARAAGCRRRSTCTSRSTTSLANQTYNTPALATLVLLDEQIRGCSATAGLQWCVRSARPRRQPSCTTGPSRGRGRRRSSPIRPSARRWSAPSTSPRPSRAAPRPTHVNAALRANGIVDTDSYRKLGRNQLRVGMFPAVDPADVEALTQCIDFVVEAQADRPRVNVDEVLTHRVRRARAAALADHGGRPARLVRRRRGRHRARSTTWSTTGSAPVVASIDPDPFFDFTQERPEV